MPVAASAQSSDELRAGQADTLRGLVLVSTPIGNLGDISERAQRTLRECDIVLCEDTRRTMQLMALLNIRNRTESLHEHNEDSKINAVLARLREGQLVVLVADAGTPLVSDPGYRLVRAAIAANLPVTAVPGPNAAITALILSGLPPMPFLFLGYPPAKRASRRVSFSALRAAERAGLSATMIWHEAPHRLAETLADMAETFGDRAAVVGRELTKRFETVERGTINSLMRLFNDIPARGEIALLVGPPEQPDPEDLDGRLRQALMSQSVKDAAAMVSIATGLPRKLVYSRALELQNESTAGPTS